MSAPVCCGLSPNEMRTRAADLAGFTMRMLRTLNARVPAELETACKLMAEGCYGPGVRSLLIQAAGIVGDSVRPPVAGFAETLRKVARQLDEAAREDGSEP